MNEGVTAPAGGAAEQPGADEQPGAAAPASGRLGRAWRGWPGLVFRTLLALLPLVWLWRRIDLTRIAGYARTAGALALAVAALAILLGVAAGALRWRTLLRAYGAESLPRLRSMFRLTIIAAYFNVLPSGMAGDALRGYRVRAHATLATSYTVLLVERVVGLVALLMIAAGAALAAPDAGRGIVASAMRIGTLATALLSLLLLGLPYLLAARPSLRALVARVPVAGAVLLRIAPARSMGGMVQALALSVVTQATAMLAIMVPLAAFTGVEAAWRCLALAPLAILLTYIPITPGAVGQRDLVYANLFGLVGVPWEAAIAVSLIFLTSQLAVAAAGGVVHFLSRE